MLKNQQDQEGKIAQLSLVNFQQEIPAPSTGPTWKFDIIWIVFGKEILPQSSESKTLYKGEHG